VRKTFKSDATSYGPYGMQQNGVDGAGLFLERRLSDDFSQCERNLVLAVELHGAKRHLYVGPFSLLKCNYYGNVAIFRL
jgi:hypothetical protein